MARNQARHWHQAWSVTWETYRDTMLPHVDQMGRRPRDWNFVRRDRSRPWTTDNVMAAQRHTVTAGKKLAPRSYLPPLELARRRAAMEQYKQKGYKGKRYKRYDRDDDKEV